ncbi:MAG: hypothetical protein PHV59_06870 [Victivallales bacterium]|nr:hypothetical protein [Victivallales bacterium]
MEKQQPAESADSKNQTARRNKRALKWGFGCLTGIIVGFFALGIIGYSCMSPEERAEIRRKREERAEQAQLKKKQQEQAKAEAAKNTGWRLLTAKEFGNKWPLTVNAGRIYQYKKAARFLVEGDKVYALNDALRNDGYTSIKDITRRGMDASWLLKIAALNERSSLPLADTRAFKMIDEDQKRADNLKIGAIYALEKAMNLMPKIYGGRDDFENIKVVNAGHWFRVLQRTSKNNTTWYKVEIPIRNKKPLIGYFNSIPLRTQHLLKIGGK